MRGSLSTELLLKAILLKTSYGAHIVQIWHVMLVINTYTWGKIDEKL
jgi:hypothetical protein